MKIINLYGGPGSGKSTTAAGLFNLLKLNGIKAEMSLEYAKDCVWEERTKLLEDQLYIFAKQHRRLLRLKTHKLEYVITDSPLLLSLIYGKGESQAFKDLVKERFYNFDNLNIFLRRVKPYSFYGRGQSEGEAKELDVEILDMLQTIPYQEIIGDEFAPSRILEIL